MYFFIDSEKVTHTHTHIRVLLYLARSTFFMNTMRTYFVRTSVKCVLTPL